MKLRAVVTGIGVVSSLGCTKDRFWEGLQSGRSGISEVRALDATPYGKRFGGEVHDLPRGTLTDAEMRLYGRASKLSILASEQALADAKLLPRLKTLGEVGARVGVIIGTTFGESQILEHFVERNIKRGDRQNGSSQVGQVGQYSPHTLSVNIAKRFGFDGPNYVIPTACAAGNYAIALGASFIRLGKADIVIAGGSDPFSRVAFSGFYRLGVMADSRCQPFDRYRKGMLVGEGAGIVVLESNASAHARGVRPYAEVLGYGLSCDATHMTIPSADGMISAMEQAITSASLTANDIDYVCAHGTGTSMNDKTESRAIRTVFYDHGNCVPTSSIKSMIGHAMGAASAIETIACVLAIQHGEIPPTINYETHDPECDIDCVPNTPRRLRIQYVLNNSFAFGGNNACIVLGRV